MATCLNAKANCLRPIVAKPQFFVNHRVATLPNCVLFNIGYQARYLVLSGRIPYSAIFATIWPHTICGAPILTGSELSSNLYLFVALLKLKHSQAGFKTCVLNWLLFSVSQLRFTSQHILQQTLKQSMGRNRNLLCLP